MVQGVLWWVNKYWTAEGSGCPQTSVGTKTSCFSWIIVGLAFACSGRRCVDGSSIDKQEI